MLGYHLFEDINLITEKKRKENNLDAKICKKNNLKNKFKKIIY